MDMMQLFKFIIIVQLFYSFSITSLAYAIPDDQLSYVTSFSDLADEISLEGVRDDIESSVSDQLDIPVIELGALIFYSGNIIIDLLLNFFFAIPEMIGLLINGFLILFNVDSYIFALAEIFAGVLVTVLYFVGLLQLLMNIRGRGQII